jgi:hypothetical protein
MDLDPRRVFHTELSHLVSTPNPLHVTKQKMTLRDNSPVVTRN